METRDSLNEILFEDQFGSNCIVYINMEYHHTKTKRWCGSTIEVIDINNMVSTCFLNVVSRGVD